MFSPEFAYKNYLLVLKWFCFALWHILSYLTSKCGCIIVQQGTAVILKGMRVFCIAEIPADGKLSGRVQIEK